eukprot:838293-Pyramimonas_sp.AAC.1
MWGLSVGVMGLPGGLLGASWDLSGASWGPLGASWGPLGAEGSKWPFGCPFGFFLRAVLRASWAVFEAFWAALGPSWAVFGAVLEAFFGCFGAMLAVLERREVEKARSSKSFRRNLRNI